MDLKKFLSSLDAVIKSSNTLSNKLKAEVENGKQWLVEYLVDKERQIKELKQQQSASTTETQTSSQTIEAQQKSPITSEPQQQQRSYRDASRPVHEAETITNTQEPANAEKIDPKCIVKVFPKRNKVDNKLSFPSSESTKQYLKMIKIGGNVAVKSVKSIPGHGVSILCRTPVEATTLKEQLTADQNLYIKQTPTRDPRLSFLLTGVDYTLEEISNEILAKNPELDPKSFTLTNMNQTKNGNTVVYMSATPQTYKIIKNNKKRLYAYWDLITLRDVAPINQCFNCGRFGHSAKKCLHNIEGKKAKQCLRCGGNHEGDYRKCTRTPHCSNCTHRNLLYTGRDEPVPTNHTSNDPTCPCYVKAMREAALLINTE